MHLEQMVGRLEELDAGPRARVPAFAQIEDRLFRGLERPRRRLRGAALRRLTWRAGLAGDQQQLADEEEQFLQRQVVELTVGEALRRQCFGASTACSSRPRTSPIRQ